MYNGLRQALGVTRLPGLHDVAQLAHVSHVTVSRVLNGRDNVRPGTRDRVLAAAREIGYQPNMAARALVTKRSRAIGVVASHTTLFGPASIIFALEQAAREEGYVVNLASLADLGAAAVEEAMVYLTQLRVDGMIVIAPQRTTANAFLDDRPGVPLVVVDGGLDAQVPIVGVDQQLGARLMTEHLLSLGHRTVHHLAGPLEWHEAEEREAGWREVLEREGAPVTPALYGDWSSDSGYALGLRLAADPDVTAVFAANDQMALGSMRALQENGRRVPEDVSLGGFDDLPESRFFGPSLTTIRQHFDAVGQLAVRTLLEVVGGGHAATGRVPESLVAPELVVRASTTSRAA